MQSNNYAIDIDLVIEPLAVTVSTDEVDTDHLSITPLELSTELGPQT